MWKLKQAIRRAGLSLKDSFSTPSPPLDEGSRIYKRLKDEEIEKVIGEAVRYVNDPSISGYDALLVLRLVQIIRQLEDDINAKDTGY